MLDLEGIMQRLDRATPGPWARHGCDVHADAVGGPVFRGRDGDAETRAQADRDAEFVAHARQDIAALLDALHAPRAVSAGGEQDQPLFSSAESVAGGTNEGVDRSFQRPFDPR